MCGRCRNVFNAFESLKRIEDDDEPYATASSDSAPTVEATKNAAQTVFNSPQPPEPSALNLGNLHEFVLEAPPEFTADEQELSASVAELDTQVSAEAEALDEPVPLDVQEAALPPIPAASLSTARAQEAPAFLLADPVPDPEDSEYGDAIHRRPSLDNPLLRTSYQTDPRPRRLLWISGIALLLAILFAQGIYFFRTTIMEIYPQTRPYLVTACGYVGCVMSWGRDDAAIKIEASDLVESPAKPGRILLTATLVNRSKVKQELPAIELRLTDNSNQVLASRIMQPRDYLGRTPIADEGLAPNAELFVNLNFEIANKTLASGYGLRAFYP